MVRSKSVRCAVSAVMIALSGCAADAALDGEAPFVPSEDELPVGAGSVIEGTLDEARLESVGPIADRYIVMLTPAAIEDELHVIETERAIDAGELSSALSGPMGGAMRDEALSRVVRDLSADHGAVAVMTLGLIDGLVIDHAPEVVADAIARDPRVLHVEHDEVRALTATQANATWGLDRIDQDSRPLDRSYTYAGTGRGVTAFVVDSGVRSTHSEWRGRFTAGTTAIDDGRGTEDCNGHGTHVAGTIGGTTFGVAKEVTIVPVRVMGCGGTGATSGIIAGLEFAARNRRGPAVANMSLGGGASRGMDQAVASAVSTGLVVVVAAGNESQDACNVSPAREPTAITVGATTSVDALASFSNFGRCVDILAPGQSITSASSGSDTGTRSLSGTSMASPHVAGAAALVLAARPTATVAQITEILIGASTRGAISGVRGSPNQLLNVTRLPLTGTTPEPTPEPEPEPTPEPTAPCTGCTLFEGSLGSGERALEPDGNYYVAGPGVQRAFLRGPTGADFDLYLYRWNGRQWVEVASGTSTSANEDVSYTSTQQAAYVWQVLAYSGSGAYRLFVESR